MSAKAEPPQLQLSAEMGSEGMPRLFVGSGDKRVPIGLSPEQAGRLGRALLAISAVCNSVSPPSEGTPVENCHFPVLKWGTGVSDRKGLPILLVEIPGGTQLIFEFDPNVARNCGQSLATVASLNDLDGR